MFSAAGVIQHDPYGDLIIYVVDGEMSQIDTHKRPREHVSDDNEFVQRLDRAKNIIMGISWEGFGNGFVLAEAGRKGKTKPYLLLRISLSRALLMELLSRRLLPRQRTAR